MSDVAKKLSRTAQYALGDTPGRGELLADMQKLATACGTFEAVVATPTDLEKCRKEFSTLNEAWQRVVQRLGGMGVTAVELMPIFQFDPQEGNYWGYMPLSFFAPHHGYGSRPEDCELHGPWT